MSVADKTGKHSLASQATWITMSCFLCDNSEAPGDMRLNKLMISLCCCLTSSSMPLMLLLTHPCHKQHRFVCCFSVIFKPRPLLCHVCMYEQYCLWCDLMRCFSSKHFENRTGRMLYDSVEKRKIKHDREYSRILAPRIVVFVSNFTLDQYSFWI